MRALRFVLAPFVDHWSGLSLTRLLATGFGVAVIAFVWQTRTIPAGAVSLAVFALAAAFGRTVFTAALARWTATASVTQTDTAAVTRTITERRDATAGIEPSA